MFPTFSPIVELRQYTLYPGQRDTLIELFEREFVESQEALGIQLIGQFRDLDRDDRFVWLRGFADMPARAQALTAFYGGPVWKAHRAAANATMLDSDNVLLLHPVHPTSGFNLATEARISPGGSASSGALVTATLYYFDAPVVPEFIHTFEHHLQPELAKDGISVLAYFVSEYSPNTFPALPVREGEHVFVWFAGFPDQAAIDQLTSSLTASPTWFPTLAPYAIQKTEVLRLSPTPRSLLNSRRF